MLSVRHQIEAIDPITMNLPNDPIGDAFDRKVIFLTGATGMLGTASLVKITMDTTTARLYVLVCGGTGN